MQPVWETFNRYQAQENTQPAGDSHGKSPGGSRERKHATDVEREKAPEGNSHIKIKIEIANVRVILY